MFTVTREWIDSYRRADGNFLSLQVRQLGLKHPLESGWEDGCVGMQITEAQRSIFEAGKNGKKKAKKAKTRACVKDRKPIKAPKPKPVYAKTNTQLACEIKQARYAEYVKDSFLRSFEWRQLRMKVLKHYGAKCMCCGATPETGAVMNVDHIKPRKTHPELALSFENLQVLCEACNHGKGNWDTTDWRPKAV